MVRNSLIALIILLSIIVTAWIDPYRDEVDEGNKSYLQKKFKKSKEHYKIASKYAPNEREKNKLRFNYGDADYMSSDYESAIDNFNKALSSENKDVQKKAFFNMGNAFLKQGKIEDAIKSYISALKIDPNYLAAKKNIEYILRRKLPKDKDKNENGNRNKSDRKNREKDSSKQKGDEKTAKRDKSRFRKGQISKEQLKNILDSMKNKPVRRQKGKDGGRVLEKPW